MRNRSHARCMGTGGSWAAGDGRWPGAMEVGIAMGVCLKIVYPYTQWLMTIIPTKWLFHWGYTPFSDIPMESNFFWDTP